MNNEKLAGMKIGEPVIGHVVDCSKLNVRKEPDIGHVVDCSKLNVRKEPH